MAEDQAWCVACEVDEEEGRDLGSRPLDAPWSMDLLLLVPTIACGVLGTLMLRASQGLRRAGPTALAIVAFVLATVGLARLLLVLPVGPVYAVWAGSASLVLLLIDWLVFKEELHRRHVVGMLLIVVGVVLLELQVQS